MVPKQTKFEIVVLANLYWEQKLKTCQQRPDLVCGRFIKVFKKMTTSPRQPLLSDPKGGRLIQV